MAAMRPSRTVKTWHTMLVCSVPSTVIVETCSTRTSSPAATALTVSVRRELPVLIGARSRSIIASPPWNASRQGWSVHAEASRISTSSSTRARSAAKSAGSPLVRARCEAAM